MQAQGSHSNHAFHILLLGDFSGRENRGQVEIGSRLAARRPRPVDRDNLDELIDRLDVQLTRTVVAADEDPIAIAFHELDDFDPDNLFENVPLFATLRELRQRLLNPQTFAAAAAEVLGWGDPQLATETDSPPASGEVRPDSRDEPSQDVASLLDRMLDETQAAELPTGHSLDVDWNRLIRQIVAPVMPRRIDPRQDELVTCVDAATQTLMLALLHHPHFQQLESIWRGIDFLVRRVETDATLKIFVLDVSKPELFADQMAQQDTASSGLYKLLVEQTIETAGAVPWSLICGLYAFGETENDIDLLHRLGMVASQARAPLLAAAAGSLVGCRNAAETTDSDRWAGRAAGLQAKWDELCRQPESQSLTLLWPRFLLRLPYGKATKPIDAFALEEMPSGFRHDNCLWGNPVILAACTMAQAFAESGWSMQMMGEREIAGLPVYSDRVDAEPIARPCGELLLTESAAQRIRARGVTPILSVRDRDVIRLPRLKSVTGGDLAGLFT